MDLMYSPFQRLLEFELYPHFVCKDNGTCSVTNRIVFSTLEQIQHVGDATNCTNSHLQLIVVIVIHN